jgi:hypothetical protein
MRNDLNKENTMRRSVIVLFALMLVASPALAQSTGSDGKPPQEKPKAGGEGKGGGGGSQAPDDPDFVKKVTDIVDALKKTEDSDFGIVLGLGSLVVGPQVADYTNESNVLHATSVGRATPQLLTGLSFRTHIPGWLARCKVPGPISATTGQPTRACEEWLEHPWSGFVSLKFSPGSSQIVDGFVLGGSFAIARYLQVLMGFSLTPINEPAPGFQTTAALFVEQEHAAGRALAFDPAAMRANEKYAFDGFPVTDSNGKLIYQGSPLTRHYRGGVLIGVAFPVYFKTAFQ